MILICQREVTLFQGINWGNDMDVFEEQEKMKEIIKTSQDYFSYLRIGFVEKC